MWAAESVEKWRLRCEVATEGLDKGHWDLVGEDLMIGCGD